MFRALSGVLLAAAVAVLGAPAPANASTPASYQSVCDAPSPGTFSCFALRRTGIQPHVQASPAGFGPSDLQSAYSLPASGGTGQTVAIVDAYDDPTAEADLAVYRQQYGLPPCTTANGCFRKVDQRGGAQYPAPNAGWAGEISLDLDMVSAVAPNAHILLVEADDSADTNLGASVDEAVALGAKFVSNSYGTEYSATPGSGEDPSETTTLDASYNHPGVAIVASSGDSGYGVSYPAASQHVTSVGGTSLTRTAVGWSETAWGGAGSGCSLYEPKPAFQHDTGCANRTVADVSAVADPATGVAVYQDGIGWSVYGGTSVSSPVIAGVYADAGTPAEGTYPNSYPYTAGAGLHDVTSGINGACTVGALCNAMTGYDGPTGLGTPAGLQAFRAGPHGTLTGTVTDRAGKPLTEAAVSDGTDVARTDGQGRYTLILPTGTRDLTVTAYGHATGKATLTVRENATITKNFALAQVPSETVSGKVTDGSGQGWPLYAKVTVDGDPNAVWTDPLTGRYQLTLPENTDYTLAFAPAAPGYNQVTRTVHVARSPLSVDATPTADPWKADAPGYRLALAGPTVPFDSTTSAPAGWSVVNAPDTTAGWQFDDPDGRGNATGGDGAFAIADSNHWGFSSNFDTSLITPVYDLSGDTQPEVAFDSMWTINPTYESFEVQATADNGATWTTVWAPDLSGNDYFLNRTRFDVPLTAYAGKSAVQLRFHYKAHGGWYWGIDNVFVGQRNFTPVAGGLVVGAARDANTGRGAVDATITDQGDSSVRAKTVATPESGGYYSLFVPGPGKHVLTAAKVGYSSTSRTVDVRAHNTVAADYRLEAGQLRVDPGSITASVGKNGHTTQTLTVTNTGDAPATLDIGRQADAPLVAATSAPLQRIPGVYPTGHITGQPQASRPAATVPADAAWHNVQSLPGILMDDVAEAYHGKIYAGLGDTGLTIGDPGPGNLFVLDPAAGVWTQLASTADTHQAPGHGIVGDKLYVAGGWGVDGAMDPKLEIYDFASDTWSTGADDPAPYAAAGSSVLDGQLYLVGGCGPAFCGTVDVSVYNPTTNAWHKAASYPEPISWASCGGIEGKLYCAGGATDSAGAIRHAYVYDPATDAWSALPDLPIPLWGSAYSAANGLLVVSSGVTAGSTLTNQGFTYNPRTGSWNALPNANTATYRGAGVLGFYKVGGSPYSVFPTAAVEYLPGYAVDPSAGVPWLAASATHLTLRPHQRVTFTVTLDSSPISQPGKYTAALVFGSSTPYPIPAVPVTLTVNPR
ncbi:carboxypeptidase regulatory-like domain-containing protein [Kutzneria sp. NPDC052558]|uniref:carboxypeptidase regulatory-like domain-containing protein n=1 Tax=Kutzneria sp. NPDC052558 TaxID=3364121 RepID=UPI0037CB3089